MKSLPLLKQFIVPFPLDMEVTILNGDGDIVFEGTHEQLYKGANERIWEGLNGWEVLDCQFKDNQSIVITLNTLS